MVSIRSNLADVIKRLDRRATGFPKRAAAAVQVQSGWITAARDAVISAMDPSEYEFVGDFIAVLKFLKTPAGIVITGELGEQRSDIIARGQQATQRIYGPGNIYSEIEFSHRIDIAERAVREWVTTPYTSRDDPASGKDLTLADDVPTEELVDRLLHIMGLRPLRQGAATSLDRIDAAEGLSRRVQQFIGARYGDQSRVLLSLARIREIWAAVIVNWRNDALNYLRQKIVEAL